ncbi:putative Transcription factor tau subunit sfc4 [Seiridium cardinale]
MKPSLDPAYIARQIMARNNATAAPPALAPAPTQLPAQPSEIQGPPMGTSKADGVASSSWQSPHSSRPPAPPPLPHSAPSPQPVLQTQHIFSPTPLGGLPSSAAQHSAGKVPQEAQNMPTQDYTASCVPLASQPVHQSSQQALAPMMPSGVQTVGGIAEETPDGFRTSVETQEPAPKRQRRSSTSSVRGRGRGRGRASGRARGTSAGRGRGRGRGRARQTSLTSQDSHTHMDSNVPISPSPLLPAIQPRPEALASQHNPPIVPHFGHQDETFQLPSQHLGSQYVDGKQHIVIPAKSPHPPISTTGTYPSMNNVQEASKTPYYTGHHLIAAQTTQEQVNHQAPTAQHQQPSAYPITPGQTYGAVQMQRIHSRSDGGEQHVHPHTNPPSGLQELAHAPAMSGFSSIQDARQSQLTIGGVPQALSHQHDNNSASEVEDEEDDVDVDDDMGDDPLLAMQNNLATFEDSVRSFAAGGNEKSLLAQFRGEQQQPRQKKIIKRGPRKPAEPTGDVKLRLSAATNAFMGGDLDEALHQVNDAIRLNAEIHRSWSLLSEILREREEYKQSLTAAVCAAHLQPKILDAWLDCGRFALELIEAEPDDAEDTLKIAIMTFSQAIKIQPDNIGVRQTRAALYLTRQSFKQAVSEYKWIIERTPYDLLALRGLADASVQLFENLRRYSDRQRWEARDAYQRAIDHYQTEYPMGGMNEELPFTWDDAFTYTALLLHLDQYGAALHATRSLARWLLGRHEDAFWDSMEDDREWDIGDERRKDIPEFDANKYSAESYGASLALRLRVNLALCRLRLDRTTDGEAMQHLEFLDPADINDSDDDSQQSELFLEVASTLYETKRLTKALPFYEPLRQQEDLLDALSLFRAGKCYLEIEDRRQAEECFTAALDFDDTPSDVRINARYELARMYEAARKNEEALYLLEEAMGIEREQKEESGASGVEPPRREARPRIIRNLAPKPILERPPQEPRPPRERKPPGLRKPRQAGEGKQPRERSSRTRPLLFALDEDRKLEEERRSAYLAEKWSVVREERLNSEHGPGMAWMAAAKTLVDDFRSFKAFYPWDRYLAQMGLKKDDSASSANPHLLKMVQRLRGEVDAQQSAVNSRKLLETTVSYRNVEFSEWLDLFLEYALSLAYSGRIKESYDVCDAALAANVFFENPDDKFLANIAKAACAVRGRDEETVVEVARSFMAAYQFCSDAFRMYAALGRLVHSSGTWFAHSKVQKFTLRQIKMMDAKLIPSDQKTKILEQFDTKTYPGQEQDVQLLMLYGHILFISNSFTFALNYFVRAAALDPDNLMVNISIGQAYLHYGLKRQTENRQQSITQGLLFLHRYYDKKLAMAMTAGQRQEAHYNLARSYHAIGLAHLAAEYYRRVFREVESEEAGNEDLAREAAFNLQQCCLIGGDLEAVRDIAERWLVC